MVPLPASEMNSSEVSIDGEFHSSALVEAEAVRVRTEEGRKSSSKGTKEGLKVR